MNPYLILFYAPIILFLAALLRILQWATVDTIRAADMSRKYDSIDEMFEDMDK